MFRIQFHLLNIYAFDLGLGMNTTNRKYSPLFYFCILLNLIVFSLLYVELYSKSSRLEGLTTFNYEKTSFSTLLLCVKTKSNVSAAVKRIMKAIEDHMEEESQ